MPSGIGPPHAASPAEITRSSNSPITAIALLRIGYGERSEEARYIVAAPVPAIEIDLARTIVATSCIFLKLCGSGDDMAALLPSSWAFETGTWMMSGAPIALPVVPAEYRLDLAAAANRWEARVIGPQ